VAWSRVLTFTDPFPYQAAIRAADLELFPTTRGNFHAELTQVTMNQVWMQRFHQSLPQVNAGSMKPGRRVIGFVTGKHSPAVQYSSLGISYGDIVVSNSDMMHQRAEADCHFGAMSLTNDDLDVACKTITGREFACSSFTHLVRPNPDLVERLLKLHEIVGEIAKITPELFELPEVVRALEQELIHHMVRCLTVNTVSAMTNGSRRHDLVVARLEAFLEANPNKPLYLTEICGAIGVAERTLRAACEEHLGMGPIRYLTLRRMHLVRRALLRADPSTATVTRLATDHGFWELGRFSVAYRTFFGESPKETLLRPADHRRILLNRPTSLDGPILHG
jgi:AraC-like DNA-binding protein